MLTDPSTELTFTADGHIYRYKGERVPSVTQVLDRYSGLEHVDAVILEAARRLGTNVHAAVHLYNEDRLDHDRLDPVLVPYVQGYERFLRESGAVVLHSEGRVHSKQFGYAGTLDIIAMLKKRALIDVKTASTFPRSVGPQTAAYVQAWHEMHGYKIQLRYCLTLKPDGTYKLDPLLDPRDWAVFQSALVVHRWLERM
jgi:hypothetical protein